MSLSPELLSIIVCPVTRQPLHLVDDRETARILAAVNQGEIALDEYADWTPDEVTALLLTQDGTLAYPVVRDIPNLLPNAGIRVGD